MSLRAYVGLLGFAALAIAVAMGLMPLTIPGGTTCGSLWFPKSPGGVGGFAGLADLLCGDARDGRARLVFILGGCGAAVLLGALLVRSKDS